MYEIEIEELIKYNVLLGIVLWDVYQDHITDDTIQLALQLPDLVWERYETVRIIGGANTDAKLYHELSEFVQPVLVKEFGDVFKFKG